MITSLMIAGVSTVGLALTYGYVGRQLVRKGSLAPEGRALLLLGGWWLATSLNQIFGGLFNVAASLGWTDFTLFLTYVYVQRLLLALSLVALLYYLIYLQTGRRMLVPLCFAYAAFWFAQIYLIAVGQPDGVAVFRWRIDLAYAVDRPAWGQFLLLMIVVPPVVGALALLRVYKRVPTTTQRFRIIVMSIGFTAWWVVAVLAGRPETQDSDVLQGLNRIVGVVVALAVLVAYQPTGWMQRRFHLEGTPNRE